MRRFAPFRWIQSFSIAAIALAVSMHLSWPGHAAAEDLTPKQIKQRLTEAILKQVPRYRESQQDRALAACVVWDRVTLDYVPVFLYHWYYAEIGSPAIFRGKLMHKALYDCEKRKSPWMTCECVRVAGNGSSALRVPNEVMDRLLKE